MSSGFESFGYDGVYSGLLAFPCEYAARHHMGYRHARLVKHRGEFLGASSRGEHYFHFFPYEDVHQPVYFRIHQRDVHAIHVGLLLGLLYPKVKQKDGRSRLRPYGISILYRMIVY